MPAALVVLDDDDYASFLRDGLESFEPFSQTLWISESELDNLLAEEDEEEEEGTDFPAGAVELNTLYISHPLAGDSWYPAADYHRLVFEDKLAEALELAAVLGARTVEAEHLV